MNVSLEREMGRENGETRQFSPTALQILSPQFGEKVWEKKGLIVINILPPTV